MEALSDLWPIKKDKHEINHQLWESRLLRSRESPSPAGLYITPRTNRPSDSTVTAWPQKSPQINACTAEYPDCFNVSNSVVNPSNLCISTHITWVIWIVSLLPNSVIMQDNFEYCRYFVQDIVGVKQYMSCNSSDKDASWTCTYKVVPQYLTCLCTCIYFRPVCKKCQTGISKLS